MQQEKRMFANPIYVGTVLALEYSSTDIYLSPNIKHLLEAEKSTFREELSFQRSESTTGFGHCSLIEKIFCINLKLDNWSKSL
jgi:hypothetical protein